MKLLLISLLLNLAYILTFCILVIAILMVIEDVKERKTKKFKISKEVDYIMSRGVKII